MIAGEDGFDAEEFGRYVEAFNRSDFDGFGGYYAPGVDFDGRGGHFQGREAVLAFYRRVKARVRETLAVQDLIVGGRELVADVVTELHALEDWPDFPTGPLRRGETRRSENFIWYEMQDRKFTRIRSAHHRGDPPPRIVDPVHGTAVAARLGGARQAAREDSMSAERFAAYIDAFNRDDYAAFGDCYADDVTLVIAGKRELRGRGAIFDFYRVVKAQTRRTIRVKRVVPAPDRVAAELESEFLALEDLPHFIAAPMKKGERLYINTFVIYELRGGLFSRIRSAEYRKLARRPNLDGASAEHRG